MFASKSIVEHLARGVVGIAAFVLAVRWTVSEPLLSLAGVVVGLVALRGCPMCWTIGLLQTIVAKARGGPAPAACIDGSCTLAAGERLHAPAKRPFGPSSSS